MAASNKNLEDLRLEGTFREDLYYRINVVKLVLPPLKKRKEDIPLLVDHFIKKFNRLSGKEIKGLSLEALSVLMSHDFPGNIRELENIIEYATVVSKGHFIDVEHLPDYLRDKVEAMDTGIAGEQDGPSFSLYEVERSLIFETLKKNDWNRGLTAAQMGIHPSTLWRKIKRLKIDIPKRDGRTKNQ